MVFRRREAMRRVVITGMGVLCAVGSDPEHFFQTLLSAKSGVRRIQSIDTSQLAVQIAAEIPDFRPTDHFSEKQLDLLDRFSQIAVVAARAALADAGADFSDAEKERLGVSLGTWYGGCITLDAGFHAMYVKPSG